MSDPTLEIIGLPPLPLLPGEPRNVTMFRRVLQTNAGTPKFRVSPARMVCAASRGTALRPATAKAAADGAAPLAGRAREGTR